MSQGTDSVRTNLAGVRRDRGKRGWRGGEERGKDIRAQPPAAGVAPCLQTALQSDSSLGWQLSFGILLHPRHSQPPRGVRQQFGGSSSCHGPSVSRGSASTVLFLAGAFWGEGKEPALNTPSREIFWGKSQPEGWGVQEWFNSKIMDLRGGFGDFLGGVGRYFSDAEATPKPCCS